MTTILEKGGGRLADLSLREWCGGCEWCTDNSSDVRLAEKTRHSSLWMSLKGTVHPKMKIL